MKQAAKMISGLGLVLVVGAAGVAQAMPVSAALPATKFVTATDDGGLPGQSSPPVDCKKTPNDPDCKK